MAKTTTRGAPETIRGLHAARPDPNLRDKLNLFGQFVRDWDLETEWFPPHGERPTGKGELHVGWILDGAAIQDVWKGRVDNPPPGAPGTSIGTTIRFYDPKLDAWRCIWTAPKG